MITMESRWTRLGSLQKVALVVAGLLALAGLWWVLRDEEPSPLTFERRPATRPVMLGWHEKGDDVALMKERERRLGKRFAIVRLYHQWRLPNRRVGQMVEEGRLVLSSHKPPRSGWRAVASGREDAMIRRLARQYKSYRREIVFVFHHEPHDNARDIKRRGDAGTSREFLAAWRRIHRIFVDEDAHVSAGGNVLFGYSASGSQALGGRDGSADKMYPGDAYVDVFAHDRYNWADCRGDEWEEFSENWAPLVRLAAEHGKPLVPAEFGSGPGGDRDQWFRNAAAWLKNDPLASKYMVGFSYYHSFHDRCPWDFMNRGDGIRGWRDAFSDDPKFMGEPFSLVGSVIGE